MTLRHDPLLALALAGEIGRRWGGRRAASLHLSREPRAAELRFEGAPSLLFLLHPEEGGLLAVEPVLPGSGARFRRLFLGDVRTPPDERVLLLPLLDGAGAERHRVAVELHTNQWNLLLLDVIPAATGDRTGAEPGADTETGRRTELRIRAAVWPRETKHRALRSGAPYELPRGRRAWAGNPPDWEAWRDRLSPLEPGARRRAALREIAWMSSVNVDYVLGTAAEQEGEEPLRAAHGRYVGLRRVVAEAPSAWLLDRPWGPQPYPASLEESSARQFRSLLDAMEGALGGPEARERRLGELATASPGRAGPGTRAAEGEREDAILLRRALLARRKRLRKRKAALERELERGPPPEELRAVGNLLLARLREVPRGADRVVLEDFDGDPREVELDPALGPAENANARFEEAARRERARERVPPQLAAAERTLEEIEEALGVLSEALGAAPASAAQEGVGAPSDRRDAVQLDEERMAALWKLAGGRPEAGRAGREEGERLPYLRYRSSGGLEIRVGRSARGNDELTFHHSSPEDIWLHARQVQGAHVILRWGRKDENPPRQDLLEAAVAAAVRSGARHSGTVAIDWTRRKYVRKPRKAPPGVVVLERARTVFVEPDARLLESMKDEA